MVLEEDRYYMIMFHLINVDINQSKRMVLWVSLFPILVHISLMFSLLQSFGQAFRTSTSSAATASLPSTQKLTMSSTSSPSSLSLADRIRGSLFGLYVADATAMPVHWMYNLYQLQRDYGTITGYVKPKDQFEGSIMNLSNTGGGGRGSDQGDIIGSVINHDKKKYWGRGGNFHYHLGLDAGT